MVEEKEITKINVGGIPIGIVGIKHLMEELAEEYAEKTDEEVRVVMLERLGRTNYMAESALDEYGEAFVREFRKFLGQSHGDGNSEEVDIKVLGAGCAACDNLSQAVKEVLIELSLPVGVDHITDLKEIARYGVVSTPALLINGKVMASGSVPPRHRIKKWISALNR